MLWDDRNLLFATLMGRTVRVISNSSFDVKEKPYERVALKKYERINPMRIKAVIFLSIHSLTSTCISDILMKSSQIATHNLRSAAGQGCLAEGIRGSPTFVRMKSFYGGGTKPPSNECILVW